LRAPVEAVAVAVRPLADIATRVVHEYLAVRAGERFVIVVDTRTAPELSGALVGAARDVDAEPVVVTIEPRARSGAEPPPPAAEAMASADVVLCAASTSLYHTAAKARAQRRGVRGVFNAPYRLDAWTHGAMTADFFAVRRQAEQLAELFRRTREVRVTSPAGTDLRARIEGRQPVAWLTGICRQPGEVSAYPGGEVSLPPLEGTANGTVVWQAVASDIGRIDEPVVISVADGRVSGLAGGREADRLRQILATVANADNIAEIGIGLNPAARISDEITESKKALGTVHIALGDSANEYGGTVESEVHLDGLVLEPTVEFDGEAVVVAGRHVYADG
jgi:leucyl aminopeptidase (aminopeptidase T)